MWKRLSALWLLIRGDAITLWRALRHPDAPFWLKAGTAVLALYLISPVDLLPELALPIVGMVDDLVLIPTAVHWMLNRLPAGLRNDLAARSAGRK